MKTRVWWIGLILGGLAVIFALWGRLSWTSSDVHRIVFPEQKPETPLYDATAKGPVSLAGFVRDARKAWPGENVAVIHEAASEVATGLLHHDDIAVGSFDGKKFIPWQMEPWDAAKKINTELQSTNDFLQDESQYVFQRRK